jgi:CheY-like chemotaxis protein
VEDDIINQQVTQAMVHSLGYDTAVAENGDDALRAMTEERFDLVLMDCHMPVRDGHDTTEEIRRREKNSGDADRIPIVAVTADFLESNRKKCLDCGMDDYVTKPFTQEHMRIVLTRWLLDSLDDDSRRPIAVDSDGFSDFGETTTLASINTEVLDELRELDSSPDADIVREIIVSYCATSTKVMLQLRSAVAEGNCEDIELIAHSLKGSSGQIGATLLATLCEYLIANAKQNILSNAMSLCEQIAVEHAAVVSGLDKELQRMAA